MVSFRDLGSLYEWIKRVYNLFRVLYKYKVLQGVLEASKLQNLGSVSLCLFVKPAKTSKLIGAKMPKKLLEDPAKSVSQCT
jgi:hypothetical protein